jgi:transcriptional regulator with XRE-family HTH domain
MARYRMTPRELGARLQELRFIRHLSLREVAEKIELPPTTLSGWERGMRFPPTERLQQLAELYDVPLGNLYGTSDEWRDWFTRAWAKLEEASLQVNRLFSRLVVL